MPVCPVPSPPPAWFLIPWPWQALFNWGACAVVTYVFVVGAFIPVQPNVRRIPHPARRRLAATLLRTAYFVLLVGEFWLLSPCGDAVWVSHQYVDWRRIPAVRWRNLLPVLISTRVEQGK
jgi:hypothetical protein